MDTEEMNLNKLCCICMNKHDLKPLFEVDNDGLSHYDKLTSSVVEMNFKEMNDQRLICGECCVTLNTVHNFRQMCLKSKTNLIRHTSLHISDHISDTVRVGLQDIKPELIVAKDRRGSEKEGSNCLEARNPQIQFQTESYKDTIGFSASIKEECENEDNNSFTHEDATVDHVNESACSDVKVEDVEHQTLMEDHSKCYIEFHKIEIEELQLGEVKEEPMSDAETPQDGSTSQADTGTSEEAKGIEETTIGTELTQNTQKDNERLHQCEICKKSFLYISQLTKHRLTHNEKLYKCEICKKGFNYKSCLIKHVKLHNEKPSERETCKKDFNQKWNLDMKANSSEKPYECEICKKGFIHRTSIFKHMKSHSSERPYECELCKKDFQHKSNLAKHMKSHFNEKSYECEICKKGFNHKWNLVLHMKIHSNKRHYECEICKKGFNHKTGLNKHMQSHSSERPYECDICKKGFKRKINLTAHMSVHSSERPFECEICKRSFKHKDKLPGHMKTHLLMMAIRM